MDLNYTQRPEELVVKYKLEPTLKELFVEGETDKAFIFNYTNKRRLDYRVHSIENINTSSLVQPGERNLGKKQLLEKLSIYFEYNLGVRKMCVYCICDKDEDKFITIPIVNSYILHTDFSCLESYAFNSTVLGKLLNNFLHKKAPDGDKAVDDIRPAVKFLFSARLIRYVIDRSWTKVEINKAISFNKNSDAIFSIDDYIQKLSGHANNRSVNSLRGLIYSCYEAFELSYTNLDYRLIMQGHDFARVVNIYQRQLGGQNISDDLFEKTLLTAIEAEDLDNYNLFRTLADCNN